MTYETLAVIAGLAVGIALIATFAFYTKPVFMMSDNEIKQKTVVLPEVQALYSRYPEPYGNEVVTHDGTTTYLLYQRQKIFPIGDDPRSDITKELRLTIKIDPFGRISKTLECGGPISGDMPATFQEVWATPCIEKI